MTPVTVRRTVHRLLPDSQRVLAKPYLPGEEITPGGDSRSGALMQRVLAIPETHVSALLGDILADFSPRHRGFEALLLRHFDLVSQHIEAGGEKLSPARRLLVGAYFTHEYSVEGAALFNPSLVLAPDQSACLPGQHRFVMSLRAVGEGHISSIEFRTGTVDADSNLSFDPTGRYLVGGDRTAPAWYGKAKFHAKLAELGAENELTQEVLGGLDDRFTRLDLEQALTRLDSSGPPQLMRHETMKIIRLLAASSYVASFPTDSSINERVLFPAGPHETRGMEDARFVRFTETDGTVRYYATYTAFDGWEIIPQLIETDDFRVFGISTLNGVAAQNKGMALFPRRIGGKYVMLSRKDRENLYLATSHDLHFWNESRELHRPASAWELLQIGNCGSPLETEAGWLVLTHGVGAMRRYAIGALLLDRDDPAKVIGQLSEPLLAPNAREREGYVPNVVYSCGGLINGQTLILPYGFSDAGIGIALVPLPELLDRLRAR